MVDAGTGFCLPLQDPATQPKTAVEGTYEVSTTGIQFSNININQTLTLTNDASRSLEFTVRKVAHTEYTDQGATTVTTNPMPWMSMGESGDAQKTNSFKVLVDGNGGSVEIEFDNDPMMPAKWEGTLEIDSVELGNRTINLSYAAGADGRWAGTFYYFAQFGDRNLDAWVKDRGSASKLAQVGNALIQRWGALRRGRIALDEFEAVLTATTQGSWSWPSVTDVCPAAACYLYSNSQGYGVYSDSLDDQPVPTGVSELPMALDVKALDATHLTGRIASSESLQYSGNPAVDITFVADPSNCDGGNPSACLGFIGSLDANIIVGGRYHSTSSDTACSKASGFALVKTPWLVPGFSLNVETDETGTRYSYECRDTVQPFGTGDSSLIPENTSLAQGNPIPDGSSRRRHLELVDGALVNQDVLYLIVREHFEDSFLGAGDSAGFSAYGLVALKRSNAQLSSDAFAGTKQTETRDSKVTLGSDVACSPDLLEQITGSKELPTSGNADPIAGTLLDGIANSSNAVELDDTHRNTDPKHPDPSQVQSHIHYFCHDTGLFDQGAMTNGTAAECPGGSAVTYFYHPGLTDSDVKKLACQTAGSCPNNLPTRATADDPDGCPKPGRCDAVLASYKADPAVIMDPIWRCTDPNAALCSSHRTDLRGEKTFYDPNDPANKGVAVFVPLVPAIDDAFRYKTQFQNRQGTSIGFAPQICVPDSDAVPYCYDSSGIEDIEGRVNCLAYLYAQSLDSNGQVSLGHSMLSRVESYLTANFSYTQQTDPNQSLPITHDGFEKLNAELLVMLGDDAYTKAFQARFDLANSELVSFEGSKFEPNGIDLAGVAGYEMYTLYQAAQYYQLALDRFYSLSPIIWKSVSAGGTDNVITQETVVSYFERLMRASTQKSRAWSKIGKRYQSFNRPDLARFVVERAYTSAYLESIVLSRLMQSIVSVADPDKRD